MKIQTINTGLFKLDGGAMFGVVPKSIWNKLNPADGNNMCTWAMRCLLIEDGNRLILVDTGIGNKQDEKFFNYFYLHGEDTLEKSIHQAGYGLDEVTDVLLTHLHFDHCGGAIKRNPSTLLLEPTFKKAIYWSNEAHWNWAVHPNPREKASFLKENIMPIQESGQLKFITSTKKEFDSIDILHVDGHTEKQMLPVITYKAEKFVFAADLIPSLGHIPIPYVMSYDTRPLVSMQEKESFLETAVRNKYKVVFQHDPVNECCTLTATERGIRADKVDLMKNFL